MDGLSVRIGFAVGSWVLAERIVMWSDGKWRGAVRQRWVRNVVAESQGCSLK